MTSTFQDPAPALQSAVTALQQGRAAQAARLLRDVSQARPDLPAARRLYGLALAQMGERTAAEPELRAALRLEPGSSPSAVALGDFLLEQGRPAEAAEALETLARHPGADVHVLTSWANALKALGRIPEALDAYERAARVAPQSGVAEHNVASILGDLERFTEAEAAARRAARKGLDAPELWLVLGRALLGQRRHDEAEAALRAAIQRRPDYVDAHAELAQLIWMRTADAPAALQAMEDAIARAPGHAGLCLRRAELLDYAGEPEAAYRSLAPLVSQQEADPSLHICASRLVTRSEPQRALWHAAIAARALPGDYIAQSALAEAWLAVGDAAQAAALAERLHERMPANQHALGLLATAWRLAGDPRHHDLYDYDSLVWSGVIDTPPGWASLSSFLVDLAASLDRLHVLRTHPVGQSVRHGSQTSQSLTLSRDPVVQAFFSAVDGAIRRRLEVLGQGADRVRSRNNGAYEFNGVWSIRLTPRGFHADHLHPMGWLSSACYIRLPSAVENGPEGWLKFGEPGVPTAPALAAEHFVKPEPGLLVLFPSYMWHGTVPFSGNEPRTTIAFDLLPGRA